MWHGLFPLLGTVARLIAGAMPLVLGSGRGRARTARGGRRGRDGNSLLAELPNLHLKVSTHVLDAAREAKGSPIPFVEVLVEVPVEVVKVVEVQVPAPPPKAVVPRKPKPGGVFTNFFRSRRAAITTLRARRLNSSS